jgi:serine/threonine protein kinase/predicted esterase
MTPDRWRQIEAVYQVAQNCGSRERSALLDRTDPEIRVVVERMLEQKSGSQLLDEPVADLFGETTRTVVASGSQLGPYKIQGQIGAGGMGTVYRAVDARLGRAVAIKVSAARYSERFEREAQAISALNHPNVCTLYDVGPDYLVMELLEGSTLAEEIGKGPMPPEQVARYGAQIASALAEAHAHAIVHRDLKPGNVMITRHGVKVLDFGLARLLEETGLTEMNLVMGTPRYMAPEQVEGREPAPATDLFALGLVLYEMATGRLPFPNASLGRMLSSAPQTRVPPASQQREGLPTALDFLIARLLAKDPADRPQSAAEVAAELKSIADQVTQPSPVVVRSRFPTAYAIAATVALVALIAGGSWFYRRLEHRRWGREEAIPEINRLRKARKGLAAFLVLRKAEEYLPGDPQLTQIAREATLSATVKSSPSGALVAIQDYVSPDGAWTTLGKTPLDHVRIPNGYFRWKLSQPGAADFVSAPVTWAVMNFGKAPSTAGMVNVPADGFAQLIDFVGWLAYRQIPSFDIDRFEVTNGQYQEFVDQGGYSKRAYWKEPFLKDGKELAWEQAMDLFRDPTGRPGPSNWAGGHFPAGQADYPVSGVSWYEAAAYAAFAGKSLPALAQWYQAAPPGLSPYTISFSNFNGTGPVPVGKMPGVGPFGTYDMSGNVREWSLNSVYGDRRFVLGGAWKTQTYQAYDPEALPPFDRSPLNGFRCVRNQVAVPREVATPIVPSGRDLSKEKPVSDELFQAYRAEYAYDKSPLKAMSDGIVEDTADWTREKITIDAGYNDERLPAFLFLPKSAHPPFETVVFFPSARVNTMPRIEPLGDMGFVDYVIQSGRALLYPIYKGTYNRPGKPAFPGTIAGFDGLIQKEKEVRRSVDYLETRPDIDRNKLAYLGVSQGSADGLIFVALEDRFKTAIFLDGGFFLSPTLPAMNQVNFAPRVKIPILMVNGRYDFTFSFDRAQEPMFRMLGTPAGDKRHIVLETPHDVSQDRPDLSRAVLAWLDKYLGKVN